MSKIVSLCDFRAESKARDEFLDLIHQDIALNPEHVEPIPGDLLDRMARIRAKAKEKRRETELLEG